MCAVEEEQDENGARTGSVIATITCCCGEAPSVRNGSWLLSGPSSGRLLPKLAPAKGSFCHRRFLDASVTFSHSPPSLWRKVGCLEVAIMHMRLPFTWFAKHSPAVLVNSGSPLPAAHLSSFLLDLSPPPPKCVLLLSVSPIYLPTISLPLTLHFYVVLLECTNTYLSPLLAAMIPMPPSKLGETHSLLSIYLPDHVFLSSVNEALQGVTRTRIRFFSVNADLILHTGNRNSRVLLMHNSHTTQRWRIMWLNLQFGTCSPLTIVQRSAQRDSLRRANASGCV